jgi:hypothetical protein
MKRKNVVKMGTLLTVMGFATLFGIQADSQTVTSFIESIECRSPAPDTTPEEYEGPQTIKALMNTFDAAYNQKFSKARVIALCKDGVVYSSELAISGEIDARYSRVEWLQMLLQRGITIEDFDDYRIYLSKRHTLAFLEDNPDLRKIGFRGMPLTDDREAYKVAYIDKLVTKQIEDRKKQMERAKKRIERAKERIGRAKKQSDSQQLEHVRKQLEDAKKQLEDTRKHIERLQEALERAKKPIPPPQIPNRNSRKRSPYPPL